MTSRTLAYVNGATLKEKNAMPPVSGSGGERLPGEGAPSNSSTIFMVGNSPPMQEVFEQIRRFAACDVPVLITGESGTGKELVARAIHDHSRRAGGPFVALNCAAVPATLIASELFGYEKGAFTGATARRHGHIEHAHQGTLFLDEIGDMPIDLQGLLLRFLQEGEILRVGGRQPIKVDVRIVAATNVRLREAIAAGKLREDLYYRLNVLTIHLPPLRERNGDIEILATYTDLRKFSDTGVPWVLGRMACPYGAGEAGIQATAQSERISPWLVANWFQAISQAFMMSARLANSELASQWLRRWCQTRSTGLSSGL